MKPSQTLRVADGLTLALGLEWLTGTFSGPDRVQLAPANAHGQLRNRIKILDKFKVDCLQSV